MIKSTDIQELEYDVQSQIAAMRIIRNGLSSNSKIDELKYFVREYCRTSDIPDELVKLKAEHGDLADEIEAVEQVQSILPW